MGDGVLMEARFLVTVGGRRTGPATVQLVQGVILVQQCGRDEYSIPLDDIIINNFSRRKSETKHGSVAFIWYKKKTVKENGVDVKILKRRPIKLTPLQQDDQGTLVEDWTRTLHSLSTGTPTST